jgi:hypothetical protein
MISNGMKNHPNMLYLLLTCKDFKILTKKLLHFNQTEKNISTKKDNIHPYFTRGRYYPIIFPQWEMVTSSRPGLRRLTTVKSRKKMKIISRTQIKPCALLTWVTKQGVSGAMAFCEVSWMPTLMEKLNESISWGDPDPHGSAKYKEETRSLGTITRLNH